MPARIKIGVVNLPNPNAIQTWVLGAHREESPRDIKTFFFADSTSLATANFITIDENTPNLVAFEAAANCPLIDVSFLYS